MKSNVVKNKQKQIIRQPHRARKIVNVKKKKEIAKK